MSKDFNEKTRVQVPAMVHMTRLGYKYYGRLSVEDADVKYDAETNIVFDLFDSQFDKFNPELKGQSRTALKKISTILDNDDLGREFYKMLKSGIPYKLIDFDYPENNTFYFTGEFTCKNGEDSFRPDITLLINGIPLTFAEVKKPNNTKGMKAESDRINDVRFPNRKFRRFLNITQLMIFSNNMEYIALDTPDPVQGAFYCTGSKKKAFFSCFREDNPNESKVAPFHQDFPYLDVDHKAERQIVLDFNCPGLLSMPEYQTNLEINSPTNRILTSMCSVDRFLYIMHYGIAFVEYDEEKEGKLKHIFEKHIMRYQQLLASQAITKQFDQGIKSGIIWHTQGSGKTALSYHLNYILTDYFAKKNTVAKFYFIVDRLDLLEQAKFEFEARGLTVQTAQDREELMKQFGTNNSLEGKRGDNEVIVVNIQRFDEKKQTVDLPAYSTNLQRIFIIDEAHRGYKPSGSFLANLLEADKDSIKIALTGTPLLKEERASWKVFGDYLHTYYYDKSIRDGYTLKIIREDIETTYKEKLAKVYQELEELVTANEIKKDDIISHERYIDPLIRYIVKDLIEFRMIHADILVNARKELPTLAGMIVCGTSTQAENIFAMFDSIQKEVIKDYPGTKELKAGLVLYDSDDKKTQKKLFDNFRHESDYDILIVYNMLLTGFDAPRLKRLYLGRELKDHGLLQAITRVNRPFGNMRHGFVIDFVDIKKNFDDTNARYIRELNRFNNVDVGDNPEPTDTYVSVFESKEELIRTMKEAHNVLYDYTTDNAEIFAQEIETVEDKKILINLRTALESARDCVNIVRSFGDEELKETFAKLKITKLSEMLSEVKRHIDLINARESMIRDDATVQMINNALNSIEFKFSVRGQGEMEIFSSIDDLNNVLKKVAHEAGDFYDSSDPEFITIREALQQRFKEHGYTVDTQEQFKENMAFLTDILDRLTILKKKNDRILHKYNNDPKYARMHKRIREENHKRTLEGEVPIISEYEQDIEEVLLALKATIDEKILNQVGILNKEGYFETMVMTELMNVLGERKMSRSDRVFIRTCIVKEYLTQFNGKDQVGVA